MSETCYMTKGTTLASFPVTMRERFAAKGWEFAATEAEARERIGLMQRAAEARADGFGELLKKYDERYAKLFSRRHSNKCHLCPYSERVAAGVWKDEPFKKTPCGSCKLEESEA